MFYTQIILAPNHPAFRADLVNAYQQHRRIESLFPDHKRSDAGVLFRWEQHTIFIQSTTEPRFDLLPKNYTSTIQTKVIDLAKVLHTGQWLQFRLLADTTGIDGETRRRVAREAAALPEWLVTRLEPGAELDEFLEIRRGPQISVHRFEQHWKLKPTSFNGYLRVTSPEQLSSAIAHGFGRSRAYGCGLMQIAPA